MPERPVCLDIYQAGKLTVVSFRDLEMLDHVMVSDCRDQIAELIGNHGCDTLAFDLTGVRLVPSGMLGMLASLGRLGVEVLLFNPSAEIREVLEVTRLDALLQIRTVPV